jgi:hypothetical protein
MTAGVLEPEVREPGVYQRPGLDTSSINSILETLDWDVVPYSSGPTWDRDPLWDTYSELARERWIDDGLRDPEGYILPELTLGWQALHWAEENLLSDDIDPEDPDGNRRLPWSFTAEQMRFMLWFYAIDEYGRFLYREVIFQRLKGHGKDPLAAVISAIEFVGPCRHAGWAEVDMPEHGIVAGDPFARPHPRAWIQIAAVSLKQTQNTMKLFNGLFSAECLAEHGIDMGKESISAYGGQKGIEAVTSSPRSLEGNRPTLVILNETHHWLDNNEGTAMYAAIERNATKAKGGAARILSITNAFKPSEDSVAKMQRESYEKMLEGGWANVGTMYDTLEAPKSARLKPKLDIILGEEIVAELEDAEVEILVRRYLTRVLEKVRGGAWWLDIPSLIDSILRPSKLNPPSQARRFWFNQIAASEEAWLDPAAIVAAINRQAKENREISPRDSHSVLEAGWIVGPEEPIVMFFDGSKSDDATALVGCRLSDGYIFTIGVWQPPEQKERAKTWLAPRAAVTMRVKEAFTRFNVVAFWGDPSHAKDDEDSSRYWDGLFDDWMRDYKDKLDPKHWPVKSGLRRHAVMFDMTSSDRLKLFVEAAEEFTETMETLNDIEEYAPGFQIDGHPAMVKHLEQAVLYPTAWGTSLMKENRESKRKIDLAVCAVGARMLRRIVLNLAEEEETKPAAVIWGAW